MADTPHENGAGRALTPPDALHQSPAMTLDSNALQQIIANAIAAHEAQKVAIPKPAVSTTWTPPIPIPEGGSIPYLPEILGKRHTLPPLDAFEGDKETYDAWRLAAFNKLLTDGPRIGLEEENKRYIFASLKGRAAQSMARWAEDRRARGEPTTLNDMFSELDRHYRDNLSIERAKNDFEKIRMTSGMEYLTFRQRYEELALKCNASYDYSPRLLAEHFIKRLSQQLYNLGVGTIANNPPKTLKEAMDTFDNINMRLQARPIGAGTRNQADSTGSQAPQGAASHVPQTLHANPAIGAAVTTPGSDPMDWTRTNQAGNRYSWETDPRPEGPFVQKQEKDARRNVRACFTCGGQHRSRQCALKPNQRNRTQARTQAKVVNAEAVTQVYHATSSAFAEPREQVKDQP
jgi:hypothetical protein